ncbi:hypothetical protein ZPAH1_orf00094 [Aeromonas phage ZPAH1]|nr:hypothetical protein ASwh1_46 [Aeromonas phage Aswh_1]QQG33856.1 hypothetical protein ZPAH1_orf00094 [Aeromonas phage ZPAH1]
MYFEDKANALFKNLGRERVVSEIQRVGDVAQERLTEYLSSRVGGQQFWYTALDFLTEEEREYMHMLKIGYTLNVNEREEAIARIQERIKQRKRP